MNIVTKPFRWIAAHREAKFVFDYPNVFDLTAVGDDGGKAVFIFDSDGTHTQDVGDFIYIDSGEYEGYHKITELLFNNWYKTETDYTTTQITGTVTFIDDVIFTLKKGYESGGLSTLLPYEQIAEFKPEPNLDGQLVVNISGYVNKIFDVINSNDTTTIGAYPVYYNTFNKVELFIDDVFISTHMVANSAITMFELNTDYVDTGRDLNGGSLGNHYLSCGESDSVQIIGDYIVRKNTYTSGSIEPAVADFSSTDFDPADFDTVGG